MANNKAAKVFYFIAKSEQAENLESWLVDLGSNPEFKPRIVVKRFTAGNLEPEVQGMISGYTHKPDENLDGFIEFDRELDPETDPAIKHIKSKFCAQFVPFRQGSTELTCTEAKLPPDRKVIEWFSKKKPEENS